MSLVIIAKDSVDIQGEATGYAVTTDSGNTYTRNFCAICGSRIFGCNTSRPGVIAIPVSVFDDRSWLKLDLVVYCTNRDEWDSTAEDVPNFDAMPPA